MAGSASDLSAVDAASDSDSEGAPGDGAVDYYHPISTTVIDDSDDSEHDASEARARASSPSNGFVASYSNGSCGGVASNQCPRDSNGIRSHNGGIGVDINSLLHRPTQNGMSGLHLSDDEEEEEKEREREAEIRRAFREDEMRRAAALTPENASRVMEAMRGVAFLGVTPDWADRVGEDNWVGQLSRIRGGGGGGGNGGDP